MYFWKTIQKKVIKCIEIKKWLLFIKRYFRKWKLSLNLRLAKYHHINLPSASNLVQILHPFAFNEKLIPSVLIRFSHQSVSIVWPQLKKNTEESRYLSHDISQDNSRVETEEEVMRAHSLTGLLQVCTQDLSDLLLAGFRDLRQRSLLRRLLGLDVSESHNILSSEFCCIYARSDANADVRFYSLHGYGGWHSRGKFGTSAALHQLDGLLHLHLVVESDELWFFWALPCYQTLLHILLIEAVQPEKRRDEVSFDLIAGVLDTESES